ncbi:MAG: thiamine phosphate synthase [Planctomycetota bacterium]|nr:thiamine phosphate synthase [Planctomycetota bacterium]
MNRADSPTPDPGTLRTLDAAFNRLIEAMRVIEDQLRFRHHREVICRRWQSLRRQTGQLRGKVEESLGPLACHRDVAGDRLRNAPGAEDHQNHTALMAANTSRAREASRSVEETMRLLLPQQSAAAQVIRYDIYQLEAITTALELRGPRLEGRDLYVLVTESLCHGNLLDTTIAAIEGGARIVQLREKEQPPSKVLEIARQLREITEQRNALLIINDSIEIAHLSGADGVHLGQEDIAPHEARRLLGPDAIIGLSTHRPEQAAAAAAQGADYIGVGPIFETATKLHREAAGTEYIRQAQEVCELPGFAIGHIDSGTIDQVIAAGAQRIAVCTGIISQPDPAAAARWLADRLTQQRSVEVLDDTLGS